MINEWHESKPIMVLIVYTQYGGLAMLIVMLEKYWKCAHAIFSYVFILVRWPGVIQAFLITINIFVYEKITYSHTRTWIGSYMSHSRANATCCMAIGIIEICWKWRNGRLCIFYYLRPLPWFQYLFSLSLAGRPPNGNWLAILAPIPLSHKA